jgi:FemAB-related protein (PEP-CTERM system-associated)
MNAISSLIPPVPITLDTDACDEDVAAFVEQRADATIFHSVTWCRAVETATSHRFFKLTTRDPSGKITGYLPLHQIRSWLFGDALVSTGFAVEGGILADDEAVVTALADAAIALASRLKVRSIELRGGPMPAGWTIDETTNVDFTKPLICGRDTATPTAASMQSHHQRQSNDGGFVDVGAEDSPERQQMLLDIPRKQRAEVRKSLELFGLIAAVGSGRVPRYIHYGVYAESVRNLGTPVFPRRLFDAVMDALGDDADTLTIFKDGQPISSVLSLYWRGTVMPYWGGGIHEARALRANERMYFELMDHARQRGMTHFDFGRSKAGSGPAAYKHNWGFEARQLRYAKWQAAGEPVRDTSAQSPRYAQMVSLWQKLPLWIANRLGPIIARQLG